MLFMAFSLDNKFLVPADRRFVQIHKHLLGFQILFEPPRSELASEAGLLVAAPRSFNVSRLHVIDPDNSGAQGLDHAESLVNVAGPDRAREPVWRVIGDSNRVGFAFERNDRSHRAK